MIRRIYPIRHSRNKWFIRLFAHHKCECHSNPLNGIFEECKDIGKIEDAMIHLSEFDSQNPQACNGDLINADTIVIKDKKINITFDYPLINGTVINITSKNLEGFTLSELIETVKILYGQIYLEESKTATEKTYELEKLCVNCVFDKSSLLDHIQKSNHSEEKECPICYNSLNNNISKLRCGHNFHYSCLSEWISYDGKTCPLCRANIKECKDCNGSLVVKYNYTGTVIPVDQRGIFMNRNLTNGKYGIYGHDFEDLFLEGFWYDKKNKNLRLFVSS